MPVSIVVVQTTVATKPQATRLARRMVDSRLAACVQVTPIRSVYRWKGRMTTAGEYLLSAKTRPALARDLTQLILQVHPYELPELVVLPVAAASNAYRRWVQAETKAQGHARPDPA